MPNSKKEPFGYGAYKTLMSLRFPKVKVHLAPEAYQKSPLKAYEIALGLKPKRTISKVRETRQFQTEAQRLANKPGR